MTHGHVITVQAPIETYLATRAEVEKTLGDQLPDGMIVHVTRPIDGGFEVLEVWESKAHADKFNDEIIGPAMARSGQDMSGPPPAIMEFEPAGLMVAQS